uniref:Uncharacterized protein n=1 Tax=Rhizophora mucronata TaxID=61149 RepID=A0A2P2PDD0_RHIMU
MDTKSDKFSGWLHATQTMYHSFTNSLLSFRRL